MEQLPESWCSGNNLVLPREQIYSRRSRCEGKCLLEANKPGPLRKVCAEFKLGPKNPDKSIFNQIKKALGFNLQHFSNLLVFFLNLDWKNYPDKKISSKSISLWPKDRALSNQREKIYSRPRPLPVLLQPQTWTCMWSTPDPVHCRWWQSSLWFFSPGSPEVQVIVFKKIRNITRKEPRFMKKF